MDSKELAKRTPDFTEDEVKSLAHYITEGVPGMKKVDPNDTTQWFELYMSGKTYTEISKITNQKKDRILLASYRQNWYDKRMQYYNELNDQVLQKYGQSKIESINTVTTMISALNKYFGGKFDKFLRTNDESIIEELDTKLLAQYHKATESIDKIMGVAAGKNGDDEPKNPVVNINMTGNSKVTQTDENTIEIEAEETDKEKAVAEVLASLSKLKKIRSSDE